VPQPHARQRLVVRNHGAKLIRPKIPTVIGIQMRESVSSETNTSQNGRGRLPGRTKSYRWCSPGRRATNTSRIGPRRVEARCCTSFSASRAPCRSGRRGCVSGSSSAVFCAIFAHPRSPEPK
jgi:hypothetical protein